MDVTKTHRVFAGIHFTHLSGADIDVIFFRDKDNDEQVRISLADGRCFTRFTLGEFCELLYAVQKEIRDRHWQETSTIEDVLANLYPEKAAPTE